MGCSSSGKKDYQALFQQDIAPYQSVKEALQKASYEELDFSSDGKVSVKSKVRLNSPVLTEDGVRNNFNLFKLQGLSNGSYIVTGVSGCYECLGFRKKIFIPNLRVFDRDYNQVSVDVATDYNDFVMAASSTTSFDVKNDGEHYLMVSADNHKLNERYTGSVTPSLLGAGMYKALPSFGLPVSISPEGTVHIAVVPVVSSAEDEE